MLLRMYMRWAEKRGYKVTLTEQSEGEQAGIKSATLQVTRPQRLWLAEDREPACTAWCASAPSTRRRAGRRASPASMSIR